MSIIDLLSNEEKDYISEGQRWNPKSFKIQKKFMNKKIDAKLFATAPEKFVESIKSGMKINPTEMDGVIDDIIQFDAKYIMSKDEGEIYPLW